MGNYNMLDKNSSETLGLYKYKEKTKCFANDMKPLLYAYSLETLSQMTQFRIISGSTAACSLLYSI